MNKEELYCHYSSLPSPSAYIEDMDYDGMGNQGRFPKQKKSKTMIYKFRYKLLKKVLQLLKLKN
jgi:hypothetical protein|tara:strand:+ start:3648 stop:3839 length:192 start_codon:yes stop_codon:yes gene_type:complete